MSYRFEKLSKTNIQDLIPIYYDAFKKKVDLQFLSKKQDTSFAGQSYVGFIAYAENGDPVAFYGVFPCIAEYRGKKYLVAQSGDTMTHSAHTGKGLFIQLATKTYEYCRQHGIGLVFGFPNENSYPGFVKKLGWVHFDDMEVYTIRVYGISWHRLKRYFGLTDARHEKRGIRILNRQRKGSPFSSSCRESDVPVLDHSADFFNYKSYGNNFLLSLAGVNVWIKFSLDYLLVGDIEMVDDEKMQLVLDKLKWLAFYMCIPYIRFQGSTHTRLVKFFEKKGERREAKYAVAGVNFFNEIPLEKMKFTAADNDTF